MLSVAALCASVALAGTGAASAPRAGVVVDGTRGLDAGAVRAARADVSRLRARGVDAELRVTHSPSESLAAAATLVTRGARTLIVRGSGGESLAPLHESRPDVRIVRDG